MINRSYAILSWLLHLFAPPPLESMSLAQKISRAFLVTLTLVVICILSAMLGALGIFVIEEGRDMLDSGPELVHGLEIIVASICVNVICVAALLQIKRADRRLIPMRH